MERISTGTTTLYFQDALGNTSHVSDASGHLLESYTYSRTGLPTFYNASGSQIGSSACGIRHLFHGQLWTQETGLNDYRNRMQLPSMGVFMQTDPIRFSGDPTHLYRFCGNNALNAGDPMGLDFWRGRVPPEGGYVTDFAWYFGVTDPQSQSGQTWFQYTAGPTFTVIASVPSGYESWGNIGLTPEQDLVVLSAFYDASATAGNDGIDMGGGPGFNILNSALGYDMHYNPVDSNTGNIWDAQGNWVGWEDPNTGNIYDAEGSWAGWNPNWGTNFTSSDDSSGGGGGGGGSYYGAGYSGFGYSYDGGASSSYSDYPFGGSGNFDVGGLSGGAGGGGKTCMATAIQ